MTTGAGARTAVVGLMFVAALGASAMGGALEDGSAAYNRGDYTAALGAWLPLAERGDMDAQLYLGAMYQAGQGVRRDYPEAVKWYRKAAEQGHAFAQYNLGLMYERGHGVAQDFVQAYKWLDLAAARSEPGHTRASAAQGRNRLAARMTTEQVAEAQRLAREWKLK